MQEQENAEGKVYVYRFNVVFCNFFYRRAYERNFISFFQSLTRFLDRIDPIPTDSRCHSRESVGIRVRLRKKVNQVFIDTKCKTKSKQQLIFLQLYYHIQTSCGPSIGISVDKRTSNVGNFFVTVF